MKTNFLIIGAAKSATTSLCNGIALHPDICFSNPKEPQFFSDSDWRLKLNDYHALFKEDAKLYGEGSTNYTKQPLFNKNIHSDIYQYNPEMKLIYIMRHPIDRIISHYIHAYNRGYETKDINTTLNNNSHFLNLSKYHFQLEPYLKRFGRSNIKLLFFDDFKNDPQGVLNSVFSFLGIESIPIDRNVLHENKSFNKRIIHFKYDKPKTLIEKIKKVFTIVNHNYMHSKNLEEKPKLSQENKNKLIVELKKDVIAIEKLSGRNLSHWLEF